MPEEPRLFPEDEAAVEGVEAGLDQENMLFSLDVALRFYAGRGRAEPVDRLYRKRIIQRQHLVLTIIFPSVCL